MLVLRRCHRLRQHADSAQPLRRRVAPVFFRHAHRTHTEAVTSDRIQVQLRGHTRILQRAVVHQRAVDVRLVILSLDDERRRCARGRHQARVEVSLVRPRRQIRRIAEDRELRPRADLRVHVRCRRCALHTRVVKVIRQRYRKMSSRREPHHADAHRIDVPLLGVRARHAHRLLRVLQVRAILRIVSLLGHAILHQQARHVDRIQPAADVQPLFIPRQPLIASARKYHRCRRNSHRMLWKKNCHRRLGNIRQTVSAVAFLIEHVRLWFRRLRRLRSAVRP